MDKKSLSERDICTKFIAPALRKAGWDEMEQIREEVSFTKGRIIVRGKLVSRGKGNRGDYILYHKPNIPIAMIEAKDNTHAIGDGMQQRLGIVYHSIPRDKGFSGSMYPAAETVGTVGKERAPRAVSQALCEEGKNC